jgi:hypothetical protein
VNETEHDATPAVPVAASVQGDVTNDPATPLTASATEPVGVPAPAPPVTVPVHVDATPTVVEAGAHTTLVDVAARTTNGCDALLFASTVLPAYAATTVPLPAVLGVNDTEHDAAAPFAASVHENIKGPDPVSGMIATEPAGLAPVDAVTVAVHVDATPTTSAAHATAVDVAFNATATVTELLLAPCVLSPA